MTLPRLALAVIGDEIGPTLDEMISFCAENDVRRLDMRTVGGRNLMGMTLDEVAGIAKAIEKAGLSVPTFVSPVLKWPMPGKEAAGGKVDFAFDPTTCPADDPLAHAFDIAIVLKARRLRVFSHLRYQGYQPFDLVPRFERLADLALTYSVDVEIENEPVCNVGSVAELAQFFAEYPEPRPGAVKPLIDIANGWSIGAPPGDADIQQLAPYVDAIHLKDRDMTAKRTVPMGDGDIPWADELKRLLRSVKVPEVLASIETHCPTDGRNATARSVVALRRIAGEIGVEVV
ncbi:MAG: TIM barrel protein [Reyranella sp.]|uniref:sugar phosphate isomerase/epimerase family protein n=1 Tax=Reyranella sp. TaxID=1929291 RepID=UPI0027317797|nr:TIM barrel protein [Reyranella sp.]MDP1961678.1 TIM barrel protein [Reyranella sp.]MDP2372293.1 TIM barrel protein [Reyranella sp.]